MKNNSQIIAAEIPEVNREKTAKYYPVFALWQMTNPNCIKAWIIQPLYAKNLPVPEKEYLIDMNSCDVQDQNI